MSIKLFNTERGKIIANSLEVDANAAVAENLVWCDLLNPTKEQKDWAESHLDIDIPTRDEMHEIELSNRLYLENNAVYCTASVVTRMDTPEPEVHAISFILKETGLVTLRYCEPYAFKVFVDQLQGMTQDSTTGVSLLLGLLEAIINRLADILERSSRKLDDLNRQLFRPSVKGKEERQHLTPDFEELLREIGIQGDLLSKVRESLLSIIRVLRFMGTTTYCTTDSESYAKSQVLLKDIGALSDQASFLSVKVGFLLDATLGLVGIQQTFIIKIFSVAAVVFLPPTLVASIYGMNFKVLPELDWSMGYPMAICMMIASAWLPYRLFKRKKWL